MQCPDCKSRRGYYKLYSETTATERRRVLVCKKCATCHTSVEVYPEGYSPKVKYPVRKSFPSLKARHREYVADRKKGITFHTEEKFEQALAQYTTYDPKKH